jgi:hypothetical protein
MSKDKRRGEGGGKIEQRCKGEEEKEKIVAE